MESGRAGQHQNRLFMIICNEKGQPNQFDQCDSFPIISVNFTSSLGFYIYDFDEKTAEKSTIPLFFVRLGTCFLRLKAFCCFAFMEKYLYSKFINNLNIGSSHPRPFLFFSFRSSFKFFFYFLRQTFD